MFQTLPAPRHPERLTPKIAGAFERKVIVDPNSGCWLWTAAVGQKGYGHFNLHGKTMHTHRLSYLFFVGDIPDGLMVLHRCDVRSCINPAHLFIGTAADNSADMFSKGRAKAHLVGGAPLRAIVGRRGGVGTTAGENNWGAKLSLEQVAKIKAASGRYREIADRFGVAPAQIGRIKRGENWVSAKLRASAEHLLAVLEEISHLAGEIDIDTKAPTLIPYDTILVVRAAIKKAKG